MMLWVYANQLQWEESAEWIIDHKTKSEHGLTEEKAPYQFLSSYYRWYQTVGC